MRRTLLVGDVHGCRQELEDLVRMAAPTSVVLLGDMFTKGPDPVGCWRLIKSEGFAAVLGNHDAGMLKVWDVALSGRGDYHTHRAVRALAEEDGVREWLGGLPLQLEGEGWLAVHAGLNPERPQATTREEMLTMRQWPTGGPFWWETWRRRDHDLPIVIYGHDARRGLLDRRPSTLGLDSGCVYGNQLTGFLLEERRILQVPARCRWCPVDGGEEVPGVDARATGPVHGRLLP